jgi:hypothetical protein
MKLSDKLKQQEAAGLKYTELIPMVERLEKDSELLLAFIELVHQDEDVNIARHKEFPKWGIYGKDTYAAECCNVRSAIEAALRDWKNE